MTFSRHITLLTSFLCATLLSSFLSGCAGAGRLLKPDDMIFRHPAVRWVYLGGGPTPKLAVFIIFPIMVPAGTCDRSIREVRRDDRGVTIEEFAVAGCFQVALGVPGPVTLDSATGQPVSGGDQTPSERRTGRMWDPMSHYIQVGQNGRTIYADDGAHRVLLVELRQSSEIPAVGRLLGEWVDDPGDYALFHDRRYVLCVDRLQLQAA